MVRQAMRKRHRNQGGFTLIELLVVITILGVLAAIVSISLLGVTNIAKNNAAKTEKATVQVAFDAMLHDQIIDPLLLPAACGSIGVGLGSEGPYTADMTKFPSAPAIGGGPGAGGVQTYKGSGTGVVTVLATFYLRQPTTAHTYACDNDGNIYQK